MNNMGNQIHFVATVNIMFYCCSILIYINTGKHLVYHNGPDILANLIIGTPLNARHQFTIARIQLPSGFCAMIESQ